jgi:THO complex subunit 2
MHSDPILLAKIMRLGRTFMKDRASKHSEEQPEKVDISLAHWPLLISIDVAQERVFRGFVSTLDEVILPSIALLPSNCGMAEELWSMMKFLPYEKRYLL